MNFAAVIAAAGFSSRMGAFKPLLPLGNRTALERVVDAFGGGGIRPIIVVGGHRFAEIQKVAMAAGARCTRNPDFRKGMFSSFKHGFRRLPGGIDAVFAHPADMPLIGRGIVRRMVQAFEEHPLCIIEPVYNGQSGRPVLIPGDLIETILASESREGMRAVLAGRPERLRYVEVDHPGVLWDMDVMEDYRRLEAYLKHRPD